MAGMNDRAQGAISGQWTVSAMGLWLFHCLMPPLVSSTHPGFSTNFGKGKRVVKGNYKKFIRLPRSARFAFIPGLSAPSATDTEIRALLVSVRLSLLSPDLLTLPCVRRCLSPILISMYRLGQVFSKTNGALPL